MSKLEGKDPSGELDKVLDDLYFLCVDLGAPILTHAYPSNGANDRYGYRADPFYWVPVLERHPELRVCFGHFGRFDAKSEKAPASTWPEQSWEWTIGRHIKANPGSPIVADLSYFSEVFGDRDERGRLAKHLTAFIREFDQGVSHIVYGSDWIMLGKEPGYQNYAESVERFLRDDCRLDESARRRIFRDNAVRFMGLGRSDRTRQRLTRFYDKHDLSASGVLPALRDEGFLAVLGAAN